VILKDIVLRNWMCFRGEHHLHLEPKAYAVLGRQGQNVERSNFMGKTALVEAVRFAYFGEHRFRTEDAWVSEGEAEGGVQLLHDDGFLVSRIRVRGKRTTVRAGEKNGPFATGDEAQALINKHLGLTLADFEASAYVRAREVARLVNDDPAERMRMVEAWLRLAPLKAAAKYNEGRLGSALGVVDLAAARLLEVATARNALEPAESAAILLEKHGARLRECEVLTELLREEDRQAAALTQMQAYHFQRDKARAQVEELAAAHGPRPASDLKSLSAAMVAAASAYNKARDQEAQDAEVADGEFDGACPVAAMQCPARDTINAGRVAASARHVVSSARLKAAHEALEAAREALEAAQEEHRTWELTEGVLQEKRVYVAELEKFVTDKPAVARPRASIAAEWDAVNELSRNARDGAEAARRDLATHARLDKVQARLEKDLEAANARLNALRTAALVLGPRGAQRRVAEPFLRAVEAGANAALAEAGVDLRVRVAWEHEGKEPASACGACGHPYPASARPKECSRCGAERGKQVVNRLDFEFSDRSDGAEDMWGVAVQMAATEWLRRARGSQLECAFFDEPWARLDVAHRRAMTRAFVHMQRHFGLRQSLVISHSPEAAGFPGIIVVTGLGPKSSKVEVVS
jgi:DNA repair exonuclease SbcCD ATPase subunit